MEMLKKEKLHEEKYSIQCRPAMRIPREWRTTNEQPANAVG